MNYNLKIICNNKIFLSNLKQIHKKNFSLLIFISEFEKNYSNNEKIINRIKETYSDIQIAMFLMTNGLYKQANMSLRSSIENFIKSISVNDIPAILIEKNMNVIFNKAKSLQYFQNTELKKIFNDIHSSYGELCKFTHTATTLHMSQLNALKIIPNCNKNQLLFFTKTSNKLVSNILLIYISIYRHFLFSIYKENRNIILQSFSKSIKRKIHENLFQWK